MKLTIAPVHHEMMPYQHINSNLEKRIYYYYDNLLLLLLLLLQRPLIQQTLLIRLFVYTHIIDFGMLMDVEIRK